MTRDTETGPLDALDTLLEEERDALLHGDLTALSDLMDRKLALLEECAQIAPAPDDRLESLKVKASRNQALLDGTLRGIRSVAARFAMLRRIRQTLETYDESGNRSTLVTQRGTALEKRA